MRTARIRRAQATSAPESIRRGARVSARRTLYHSGWASIKPLPKPDASASRNSRSAASRIGMPVAHEGGEGEPRGVPGGYGYPCLGFYVFASCGRGKLSSHDSPHPCGSIGSEYGRGVAGAWQRGVQGGGHRALAGYWIIFCRELSAAQKRGGGHAAGDCRCVRIVCCLRPRLRVRLF